jgi:pyruvate dehydrogenase E1 component beta subunit
MNAPQPQARKTLNTIQDVNLALDEAMGADANVILLGEDIADEQAGGICGVTKGLSQKYGKSRVRSTPISEQAIIGAAIGAAIVGMRPVAEIMLMNFTTVAMDMLVNHAAKLRFMSGGQTHVPITIRTMTGAGFGTGGQHADYLEAWFAHTAGIKVVAPSSPADAYGLMLSCIFDDDPCLFIENLPTYWNPAPAPEPGVRIPLGRANVLRAGGDVTVITYSRTVADCAAVAEKLGAQGVGVELIDLRTIAPLDMETVLQSVARTRRAVIVHEAVKPFGVGAEIAARIGEQLFGQLKAPVGRVGAYYSPVPFSKTLETEFVPTPARIEAAIRATLK